MAAVAEDPDIRRYWMRRHYPRPLRWQLVGGADPIYLFRGVHPIVYNISEDGYSIFIRGGHKPRIAPCFVVEIDETDRTAAILQEVERRRGQCFQDGHVDSRSVVRAAAELAAQQGVRTLRLTDWSYILCPEKVHLADLSFLTTGRTWYESILPGLRCVSPEGENLELFRQLARTNTWRQVGDDLLNLRGAMDIDAPGSALDVLTILKRRREFCGWFARHMGLLLRRSGIDSLKGAEWICELEELLIRSQRKTRRKGRRSTNTLP